jgi:hypothetical protein
MSIITKIFGKPRRRRKPPKKPIEEEIEEETQLTGTTINWGKQEEEKEEPQLFEKKKRRIIIPKGKALIDINKRSWTHIIIGTLLVIVNVTLFFIGILGWVTHIEEKLLIMAYTLPSIYVTLNYTWIKIQGKPIEENEDD